MSKMNTTKKTEPYSERIRHYAEEKRRLDSMGLDPFEYENFVRVLARKWRV